MRVIVDTRWVGIYGIQRFASEVIKRVPGHLELRRAQFGPRPSSPVSPYWLALQANLVGHEVLFSPGYMPPAWCRSPYVFTIHDLIHIQAPTGLARLKNMFYSKVVRPAALRASRILTVSEYSKQQIVEWLQVEPDRVRVVGNGVDPFFCPGASQLPRDEAPFILYVGGSKPHKNLSRLLRAWRLVAASKEVLLRLSGPPLPAIEQEARKLGIFSRVKFTGLLSEAELREHYWNALALVLPSLHEGFGLPAIEAMACGTPVVASRTTALPEVIGTAGVFFDPYDEESIAAGISRVLADRALREELVLRGLERARDFSWDHTAKLAWDAVEEAGQTP